jgi:hypothetical protein
MGLMFPADYKLVRHYQVMGSRDGGREVGSKPILNFMYAYI